MNPRKLQTSALFMVLFLLPAIQTFAFRAAVRSLKNKTEDLISHMENNKLNCTSFRKDQNSECLKNLEINTSTTTNNNDFCDLYKTFYNHFTEASNLDIDDVPDKLHPIRQSMKDLHKKKCKPESTAEICRITETTDGHFEKFCKVLGLLQTFKERLENLLKLTSLKNRK